MAARRFPVEYIDRHDWFGPVLCPAFNGEQYGLRQCVCGAQRWFDEDGVEHMTSGYVPHPIRRALDDPGWLAVLAVSFGTACPLSDAP